MQSTPSPGHRPDLHRRLSPWRERAVLWVAALGAGALVLLATVGLGNSDERVRAEYRREGDALAAVVDLEWTALLDGDELPGARGPETRCAPAPEELLEAARSRIRTEDSAVNLEDRAAVEVALRTAEAFPRTPEGQGGARHVIGTLVEELGVEAFTSTGESGGRLQFWCLRDALDRDDRDAIVLHSTRLRRVDGRWADGGVPLPLLAWLACVDDFAREDPGAEHHDIDRASLVSWGVELLGRWLAGELGLPPEDLRLRPSEERGLAFEVAPERAALERALDRAYLELGIQDWIPSEVIGAERALRGCEAEWGIRFPLARSNRWELTSTTGGWVAARDSGGGALRVTWLEDVELGEALAGRVAGRDSWPEDAELRWIESQPEEPLEGARALGPAGPWVQCVRRGLEESLAAERRRVGLFRGGLGLLAVGVMLFGFSTFRTLRRGRALQEQKSRFVASVSHELRTPTASILLLAENLEEDRVRDDAGRRRYGGLIRREAVRLRRLVDDVLDVTRLERGAPTRLRIDSVGSEGFFAELQRDLGESAGEDPQLRWKVEELPTNLRVDGEALRRAVWNLVDNARAHAKAGRIEVAVRAIDGHLEVGVRDDGRGIPSEARESIFEAFVRLDADLEGAPGTGLGLVIVREIARGHGGSVEVGPGLGGRGVGFLLRLPIDPDGDDPHGTLEEGVA